MTGSPSPNLPPRAGAMPHPPPAGAPHVPAEPPFPPADGDAALRDSLRRHRLLATALLGGMAALTVGSHLLPPGSGVDLLRAAAAAGLVGGLADWFAVTALFRRPLGLPIPHTAIIPRQKERLGAALGRFVADHVFTEAEVARLLARLDLATLLRGVLTDPEATRPAARAVAASIPRLLERVQDGAAGRWIVRLLPRLADGPAATRLLARVLRTLVEGGRHRDVFDLALRELRDVLRNKERSLHAEVEKRVRESGGSVVGWVAGAYVARRVVVAVNEALDEALSGADGENSLRAAFDEWVMREIDRLEHDPDRARQIGEALRAAIRHGAVAGWLDDAWHRVRWAAELDAARPEGRIAAAVGAALNNAGQVLAEDPGARNSVNAALERLLLALLPRAKARLSLFIAGVVGSWDTDTVTERIELRVGRDLQYVRMNGTLVGFLAGGAVFLVLEVLFGRVGP